MRANEFINETINKETLNPKFKHSIEDNGITYTAKYIKYGGDGKSYFAITATQEIDNQTVRAGEVMFRPKTDGKGNYWLESYMTWVKPDYRKLGVTRMMYAYAKMLGNDIKPSHDQTPRGQAMWQSWKDSGDAEHLMKEDTGTFSKVMTHETTPEAAAIIMKTGFKPSPYGIFFNVAGTNYSGGGYGGTEIRAQITGPVDDILNLEDDNDLPDDLDDFADGEEIANYAREEGYWAWTDGVQFAVLDPRHIKVIPTNG